MSTKDCDHLRGFAAGSPWGELSWGVVLSDSFSGAHGVFRPVKSQQRSRDLSSQRGIFNFFFLRKRLVEYWGKRFAEAFTSPLQLHRAGPSRGEKGASLITGKSTPRPVPGQVWAVSEPVCPPGDILFLSTGQSCLHVPDCPKHWLLIATINDGSGEMSAVDIY